MVEASGTNAFKWRLDKLRHIKAWRFYGLIPKLLATQNDKLSCEATQVRIILT